MGSFDERRIEWQEKTLKKLEGGKYKGKEVDGDGFPILKVDVDGKELWASCQQDSEGNGPGHLHVEKDVRLNFDGGTVVEGYVEDGYPKIDIELAGKTCTVTVARDPEWNGPGVVRVDEPISLRFEDGTPVLEDLDHILKTVGKEYGVEVGDNTGGDVPTWEVLSEDGVRIEYREDDGILELLKDGESVKTEDASIDGACSVVFGARFET